MPKRKKNPLPGKSAPLNSGAYNWTRSFSHGGSEMIGDANLSKSGKSKRRNHTDRGPAIFALALIGITLLIVTVTSISELFQ